MKEDYFSPMTGMVYHDWKTGERKIYDGEKWILTSFDLYTDPCVDDTDEWDVPNVLIYRLRGELIPKITNPCEEIDFAPRKSISSRYATTKINSAYYSTIRF